MTRRRSTTVDPQLDRRGVDLMLLALGAALLPHLSHLPLMVVLLWLAFAAWRWMVAHHQWPLPGMPVRTLLTVLVLSAVYFSFGTVFGRDAGAALLVIMLGLKLLEVRLFRDAMIVLFLGYFLAVMMVLFSQDLVTIVALVAALLLITAALIELNHPSAHHDATFRQLARRSAVLLLQAAPLMVIMFVLFPRVPGPLWGLPEDAYSGRTGLSDSMSPGSISALGRSNGVAFRASFDGVSPPPAELYWRGPVFWYTDGHSWSPSARLPQPETDASSIVPNGTTYRYTVTLEPHNRRWLFTLEMPVEIPDDSSRGTDLTVLANEPVRQLTRYRLESVTSYRVGGLDVVDRQRALQLPAANPRARALGASWRRQEAGDAGVVRRALEYFRGEPFYYTLTPPLLGRDPIDAFLFDSRRGFCEHYAAAFTVLMRAAGVPARVVTGYQGGELNPIGDYLIVRQRDAHAWAEVWLDDRGWVRVDPTAAVAPHRIEHGSADALLRDREAEYSPFESGALGALWRHARFGWDTLNNRWNQWVLSYGPASQTALLSRFGLGSWIGMALTMLSGLALLLLTIAAVLLIRCRDGDPVVELYRRFCAKLARRGITRAPQEGPAIFAERASRQRPDLAAAIAAINRRYIAIRYGGINTERQLRRLRRDIAVFRP